MSQKIGIFNCRGLSDTLKRADIFEWIRNVKKLDICILTETHSIKRIESKWKTEWDGPVWFSSYKSNSRGVAILFKDTFSYKIHSSIIDKDGRYVILDMSIKDKRFSLVGLYGPNEDNPTFFRNLKDEIDEIGNVSIIAGGDWNVVLDYEVDCKNYVQRNNQKSNEMIHEVKEYFNLEDVWRINNHRKKKFSWFGPNRKMGRLDYFLVSSDIAQMSSNTGIDAGYRSDHSLCYICTSFTKLSRGKGTWKFNNSLLYDDNYVKLVKSCIADVVDQYKTNNQGQALNQAEEFTIDDQLFFEMLKVMIRGETIQYASRLKKKKDLHEKSLNLRLQEITDKIENNDNMTLNVEKEHVLNELERLRVEKTKGVIMRTKAKWITDGEKNTQFFCNLEKRNFVEKTMQKVVMDDGSEVTDMKQILKAQKDFYKELYTTKKQN